MIELLYRYVGFFHLLSYCLIYLQSGLHMGASRRELASAASRRLAGACIRSPDLVRSHIQPFPGKYTRHFLFASGANTVPSTTRCSEHAISLSPKRDPRVFWCFTPTIDRTWHIATWNSSLKLGRTAGIAKRS